MTRLDLIKAIVMDCKYHGGELPRGVFLSPTEWDSLHADGYEGAAAFTDYVMVVGVPVFRGCDSDVPRFVHAYQVHRLKSGAIY